jgi:hypothetical protein
MIGMSLHHYKPKRADPAGRKERLAARPDGNCPTSLRTSAARTDPKGDCRLAAVGSSMHHRGMTKYLISFPSEAMALTDEEFPIVSAAAHAVIEEAKAAGVYVFGGGINEQVDPVLVSRDGSVSAEIYPGSRLKGGFTVLELPTRDDAVLWAGKIATACRCSQELREFMYDPAS